MSSHSVITILGATGSIGDNTLALVRQNPDLFRIKALVGGSNVEKLADLALEFTPDVVGIADATKQARLAERLLGSEIKIVAGDAECKDLAAIKVDIVIAGIVGLAGLPSMMKAVEAGQTIGLANKESLVSAGHVISQVAAKNGARIIPLDSEHSAIFQCWHGWQERLDGNDVHEGMSSIQKICLTASGGPFLTRALNEFASITPQDAVAHPNWEMGRKISVDSATMMNKGLEVIEAHFLFDLPAEQIEAVIHPQSIIHGMIHFRDGSIIAQLSSADMQVPISYALKMPGRLNWDPEPLDIVALGKLEFLPIEPDRFPCFALAQNALIQAGTAPAILNGANEVAVAAFLAGHISFSSIATIVADSLATNIDGDINTLDAVIAVDNEARRVATVLVEKIKGQ
ncbi:1-deoxy-D-xylulose-5-phosphate reductoisomerase [Candidatus Puniceispirillum marinum]|uniref:1-deoxy-D-xylulose 5-phosphate reductoisomerase n=1 Tax=Puniceispirillum marinum (strain IMCC1322) TaxID=488538 RepID=D5BR59_PUNMI|nr:1-deoxy-D-xylulose-5-phosphate reductoisomerase [Candidatus Puniceispirillum marinum]ADE38756.1 1-deoxy-D-xylulose 5-phosphate reductoisomerase [Candidatus Puniceispirillum marinum IMCC1322]